jgi:UDP-GlcNAc3NAcA epimerase
MKIVTIIGARPQIIKAAALSRAVRGPFAGRLTEVNVHTGQHYDQNMSEIFFEELDIPAPDYNLHAGSGSHARQSAAMLTGIEEVLVKEKPRALVLYGDTNSTLAGAIAGSKLNIPVVHIEAGLRSFNRHMPEEINRITCDHASTLLFSPTKAGYENLLREGFRAGTKPPYHLNNPGVYHCGDVMFDNSLHFAAVAEKRSDILARHGLEQNNFILATIHRDSNTDDPVRLNSLLNTLYEIHEKHAMQVILPLHPRTRKLCEQHGDPGILARIRSSKGFILCEPVSFLDMVMLEKSCRLVITDSGGVQKEAFYFEKPCIILRPETEWVELVDCGAAALADASRDKILAAYAHFTSGVQIHFPKLFGDGRAAEFICGEIVQHLS